MSQEDEAAGENPLIVMTDEETGDKYARAVGYKGIGEGEEGRGWLVKDMREELRVWGHCGGQESQLIMKCDGERPIKAVRDALAKEVGGRVVPESPAKGESRSNGAAEEAGKTVREFVRVLKDQVETRAEVKLRLDSVLVLWMVRWAAMICSRYLVGKMGGLHLKEEGVGGAGSLRRVSVNRFGGG